MDRGTTDSLRHGSDPVPAVRQRDRSGRSGGGGVELGSIVGPLIGGGLLASGFGPGIVPAAAIPGLAIALMCLLRLARLNGAGASS